MTTTATPQRRREIWGRNLTDALDAKGWTAKRLHAEIGGSVSLQAVYLWKAGTCSPRSEHQAAIARALGMPSHLLFPAEVA